MSNPVARRIDKAIKEGYTSQPRHGKCLNCGGDWDECPCNRAEVDGLIEARLMQKRMEKLK